jgi:hypothetical protein
MVYYEFFHNGGVKLVSRYGVMIHSMMNLIIDGIGICLVIKNLS